MSVRSRYAPALRTSLVAFLVAGLTLVVAFKPMGSTAMTGPQAKTSADLSYAAKRRLSYGRGVGSHPANTWERLSESTGVRFFRHEPYPTG
jgi:hypothetical protein